jgi:hypothetical protein
MKVCVAIVINCCADGQNVHSLYVLKGWRCHIQYFFIGVVKPGGQPEALINLVVDRHVI